MSRLKVKYVKTLITYSIVSLVFPKEGKTQCEGRQISQIHLQEHMCSRQGRYKLFPNFWNYFLERPLLKLYPSHFKTSSLLLLHLLSQFFLAFCLNLLLWNLSPCHGHHLFNRYTLLLRTKCTSNMVDIKVSKRRSFVLKEPMFYWE